MTDEQYCPTRSGSFTGYEPQWYAGDGWIPTPMQFVTGGVPFPLETGGILHTIGLCSKHQALSLAHAFAAVGEAEGKTPEVRIQPYRVHYDIKARVMDSDEEPMP